VTQPSVSSRSVTPPFVHEVSKMVKRKEGEKSPRNFDNDRYNRSESFGDEEPNFSDDENFVDDITDEGEAGKFYFLPGNVTRALLMAAPASIRLPSGWLTSPLNAIPNINIIW
jgi:hypothetical protein